MKIKEVDELLEEINQKYSEEKGPFDLAIKVNDEKEAEFLVSYNNGVYAVYPKPEIIEKKQGPYWQYLEGAKCMTFSEKGHGCITGTYEDMRELLKGKKIFYAGGIYESLFVPFSKCFPEGENGVECLGRKIERGISRII